MKRYGIFTEAILLFAFILTPCNTIAQGKGREIQNFNFI
jgi:predicted small secreted protein